MKEYVIPPTYATVGERTKAAFDWEVNREVALKVANACMEIMRSCEQLGNLEEAWHQEIDAHAAKGRAARYDTYAKAVRATPIATPETDR